MVTLHGSPFRQGQYFTYWNPPCVILTLAKTNLYSMWKLCSGTSKNKFEHSLLYSWSPLLELRSKLRKPLQWEYCSLPQNIHVMEAMPCEEWAPFQTAKCNYFAVTHQVVYHELWEHWGEVLQTNLFKIKWGDQMPNNFIYRTHHTWEIF